MKRIHLGCGTEILEGYENYDLKPQHKDVKKINLDKKFPFKKDSVDKILMHGVIEHIQDTDHLLKECRRVMKKEAILQFSTPNINSLAHRIQNFLGNNDHIFKPHHLHYWDFKTMEKVLNENGFQVIKSKGFSSRKWLPKKLRGRMEFWAKKGNKIKIKNPEWRF